ncbi:MAG: murein biosynthesis integral membrane protein MurJ [candidate division NC10 bacterium]|nr:murein biosynthesis integral membrane protein MurJ [candidate division NC10 bacterium]
MVDGRRTIARAAGVISAATFLSRILGFIRDMVVAKAFGAGMATDSFFVAFRLPNMLRELLGEGALSAAFVPVFAERLRRGGNEAWELARKTLTVLGLLLIAVSLLGVLLAPALVRILAPGFSTVPEKLTLTIRLTRWIFPYIFCVGIGALFMGILNALGHFATPALSPVMLNLAMIASVLFLASRLDEPIFALAYGVLLGGILQLCIQVPIAARKGLPFRPTLDFEDPSLLRIGRLMIPGTLGLAITQINVFIGTFLASFLDQGSISYLYYAFRLIQFPIGLFGVALATALLPTLSSQASVRSLEAVKGTLMFSMRFAFFLTLPAMLGLIVFRVPIIFLLFERGEFTRAETLATAEILLFYSLGLMFYVLNRVVAPVYYAFQDTKTPVLIGAGAVLSNIVFSLLLMPTLGARGLALATSLSSLVNFFWLVRRLKSKLGPLGWGGQVTPFVKTSLAALTILLLSLLVPAEILLVEGFQGTLRVGGVLAATAILFLLAAWLMRCEELNFLKEALVGRGPQPNGGKANMSDIFG